MSVAEVKEVKFMTLTQRDREKLQEGIEQGIEQGIKQGIEKAMCLMKLFYKGYSINEISKELEIEEDKVKKFVMQLETK